MGSATDLPLSADSKAVQKAWELFVSGDDRYLEQVHPDIRESWLRSRQAGVDPAMRQLPHVLSPEALEQLCRQQRHLLEAGRMAIALLSHRLGAFIANIADSEGNLLYSHSSSQKNDKRKDINLFPGVGLRENLVGTTSPGLALYVNRPVHMQGYEYYAEFAHQWVGFAVPVHSSCGGLLGTFSVARYGESTHAYRLDLVTSLAAFIDKEVAKLEQLGHLEVLKEFNHYLLKFPETPLLALCAHGCILALSPALAKLLPPHPPDRLLGRSLHSAQELRFDPPLSSFLRNDLPEPSESSLTFLHREQVYPSTVIPLHSTTGAWAGSIVLISGLTRFIARKERKTPWRATYRSQDLLGHAPAFRQALHLAQKAAQYDRTVLLIGESGTGKELFAQAIHQMSHRASGPFVALNCGTIPKDLVAAELFGYEEGAFSGALRGGKRGKIALAHQGTLFLDELADMPAEIQLGFLRFLEEGQIVPLGSEHPRLVDVRVIVAMNLDPALAVAQGKLRLDLYHRLNQLPISLPPLRARMEDLSVLIRHLLDREGFPDVAVSPKAMEIFRTYSWPGNIRELQNILTRAAIFSSSSIITPDDLPPELLTPNPPVAPKAAAPRVDQAQIQKALQECGGNISRAAQRLGIHRVTLHKKLRAYGHA